MNADVNGISLAYDDTGSGDVVLLVPGFASNRRYWRGMIRLLEGFRAVAVDIRGSGETVYGGPFSIRDLAEDMVGLLDHLGVDRAHVVGWSMGSHVGQCMALAHPDRVRSLTMVSTHAVPLARTSYLLRNLIPMAAEGRVSMDAVSVVINAMCVSEGIFRSMGSAGMEPPIPRRPEDPSRLIDQLLAAGSFDISDRLGEVSVPSMVVQGTEDLMSGYSQGELVASLVPGCAMVSVPGAGHSIPAEAYSDRLVSFLRSVG